MTGRTNVSVSTQGQGRRRPAHLVMQDLHGVGLGVNTPSPQRDHETAGGILAGGLLVLLDPCLPHGHPLRVDGPDARTRPDVGPHPDAPGLRTYARTETALPLAHAHIDQVRVQRLEALQYGGFTGIELPVQHQDAKSARGAVESQMPIRVGFRKLLHPASGSDARLSRPTRPTGPWPAAPEPRPGNAT